MPYSKENKEKIDTLIKNPELVYRLYITEGRTTVSLAEEWGLPKSTVYGIAKKLGLIGIKFQDKVTHCNEELFNVENPVFCYMAGLMSVDGYIDEQYHRVCLRMSVQAKEVLERLREYFEVSNVVAEYTSDSGFIQGYKMYDLTISSKKLLGELEKLNIYGRKKDLLVRFPDMSSWTDECQEMYMRGVWDGDGTIRKSCISSIFEQSYSMIKAIEKFILEKFCGTSSRISERLKPNGEHMGYDLYINGSQEMYEWMYRHNPEFGIVEKYLRQF